MPTQALRRFVPRRRRSRIAVVVVVLVGGLVVADRTVASVAAGRLADRLQCAAGLADRPDVDVDGFPFLSQALRGRYAGVDVIARGVRRGELRLATVRASLRDTVVSAGTVSVGAARIEAVVPFDALPDRVGERPVTYGESGGLLAVTTTATLAGRQLPVTLLGRPAITDGTLRIDPQDVVVLGVRRPAGNLVDRLGVRDGVSRELPDLPAGLRYGSVGVKPDGLSVTVTGTSLSVRVGATAPSGADDVAAPKRCGASR
jgi:hypothetical protein